MSTEKVDAILPGSATQNNEGKMRKYLIFMINDEGRGSLRLGIDAEYVVEILNNYSSTYLPMVPGYIRGVFNMRGQIIPIMDIRLRLDKSPCESNLLIVINYNEVQVGLMVDMVDRILDIDETTITTVPSQESQRFVSGMCTLPDQSGTLLILNCEQLFAHE